MISEAQAADAPGHRDRPGDASTAQAYCQQTAGAGADANHAGKSGPEKPPDTACADAGQRLPSGKRIRRPWSSVLGLPEALRATTHTQAGPLGLGRLSRNKDDFWYVRRPCTPHDTSIPKPLATWWPSMSVAGNRTAGVGTGRGTARTGTSCTDGSKASVGDSTRSTSLVTWFRRCECGWQPTRPGIGRR